MLITPAQLRKVATTLKVQRAAEIAGLLNELCLKYGITEKNPFQMFLANVIQESGEFASKVENMNYQAKTILKTWPKRFKDLAAATPYARNPEKLANSVYGKRMGNKLPGDGWQFRGAGFIGITGRELYTKYAAFIKKDVIQTSDLMRTEDRYALDSACWFFADLKKLISVAKKGDFIAVVKGINGGTTGLSVRQKYYNAIKKVFSGE